MTVDHGSQPGTSMAFFIAYASVCVVQLINVPDVRFTFPGDSRVTCLSPAGMT